VIKNQDLHLQHQEICEGSVSDSDLHSRKKLIIMCGGLFVKLQSKSQNDEMEKYFHVNLGRIDLSDLLDC
jgi:hypothetical protein